MALRRSISSILSVVETARPNGIENAMPPEVGETGETTTGAGLVLIASKLK